MSWTFDVPAAVPSELHSSESRTSKENVTMPRGKKRRPPAVTAVPIAAEEARLVTSTVPGGVPSLVHRSGPTKKATPPPNATGPTTNGTSANECSRVVPGPLPSVLYRDQLEPSVPPRKYAVPPAATRPWNLVFSV